MADCERDDSVGDGALGLTGHGTGADGRPPDAERHESAGHAVGAPPCPECAAAELTLIRDAPIVSVYKCPKCGHLSAPVKRI